jgi:hypothetical protein
MKAITPPHVEDDPLPWLLTLEIARQRGDFIKAATAQRELERLGVRVTYGNRPAQQPASVREVAHVG